MLVILALGSFPKQNLITSESHDILLYINDREVTWIGREALTKKLKLKSK